MTSRPENALARRDAQPNTPGSGDYLLDSLDDPRESKKTMRLMRRASRANWGVGEKIKKHGPKRLAKRLMAPDVDTATLIEGLNTLARLERDNIAALEAAHHAERLESGQSTENHAVASLTPDIIAAALGRVNDTQAGG